MTSDIEQKDDERRYNKDRTLTWIVLKLFNFKGTACTGTLHKVFKLLSESIIHEAKNKLKNKTLFIKKSENIFQTQLIVKLLHQALSNN